MDTASKATAKPTAATVPLRVQVLSQGLLNVCADFFDRRLQTILDEFQDLISKESDAARARETRADQYFIFRALQSNRHDVVPEFLAALQRRLNEIRNGSAISSGAALPLVKDMALEAIDTAENAHLLSDIAARCESQHKFELFLLSQRFGVLAASPAWSMAQLPLGPRQLCACLDEATARLALEPHYVQQLFFLFEHHIFGDFGQLLRSCNQYLIEQGLLPGLTFVPFRNPELRHKKSPIALSRFGGVPLPRPAVPVQVSDELGLADGTNGPVETASVEHSASFEHLQQLLQRRKQLLNKLNSFSNEYLGLSRQFHDDASRQASAAQIGEILKDFQQQAIRRSNPGSQSIQHLKHDLMAQLRNISSSEQEWVLAEADNDAIDLVGLMMDQALKEIPPESAASGLIGRLQAPLLQAVVADKSFFSNQVHPARELLETMADAGFNWLDQPETDDTLHTQISDILEKRLANFDGDSRQLKQIVDETRKLLQAMRSKAEGVERRQVEVSRGKERLKLARLHAESTMHELLKPQQLEQRQADMLKKAWSDVLALTELRSGTDSPEWRQKKAMVESIIASQTRQQRHHSAEKLQGDIENALTEVGYHPQEAQQLTQHMLEPEKCDAAVAYVVPEKVRLGSDEPEHQSVPPELDDNLKALAAQLEALPIGSWFEFIVDGSSLPVRRKLAWRSTVLGTVLFVNQRGHKTCEMRLAELAIEVSEGRVRREPENKRSIFERAFASVLNSLRSIMPARPEHHEH
jgi:Protein of unknown function (DUF1631)